MTLNKLSLIAPLAAALILLPACNETQVAQAQAETAQADAEAPQTARDKLKEDAIGALPADQRPKDYRPPFSKETVLKLNPIVERSKLALDRFDAITDEMAAAKKANDTGRIKALTDELVKLKAASDQALTDFKAQKTALIASKEYYDTRVLAGMELFVTGAPDEIGDRIAELKK